MTYSVVGRDIPRDQWLATRATGIGASEIASILGVGFETPADVWARKIGVASDVDLAAEVERIHWGNVLETVIVAQYASDRYAGRESTRSGELLRSTLYPWAMTTLDAWTMHPVHRRIPLEAKSADAFRAEEWEDGAPERYYLQVQHQLLVTGAPMGSIAVLIGGNRLAWQDIPRDEAAIARIIDAGERFWALVEAREPPPPDATAEWAAAFAAAFPEASGTIAFDELDVRPWAGEFIAALDAKANADARLHRARNEIIRRIGSASEGRFRDGSGFTYRTSVRRAYAVEETSYRVLRSSAVPSKRKSA